MLPSSTSTMYHHDRSPKSPAMTYLHVCAQLGRQTKVDSEIAFQEFLEQGGKRHGGRAASRSQIRLLTYTVWLQ